jgi:hypothetical protein
VIVGSKKTVRTLAGRIQTGDLSNALTTTVKRGDKEVRAWSVIWYSLVSDGVAADDGRAAHLWGPIAARVASLSLHHFDISFCERVLKEHHPKFVKKYSDLSLALWIAVLTKFMSCFRDSKARPRLDPKKVFGANSVSLQQFELLMALRNKHVVHDENSHYEAAAFAWLEPNGDVRSVGPMLSVARIDPELVTAMRSLVEQAQGYINNALADAGKELFAQVQAMTPEERMALPTGVYFPLPSDGDIKQTRR